MNSIFQRAALIVFSSTSMLILNVAAYSAMRWEGFHHADGQFEFVIGDTLDGDLQTFWLDASEVHPGRDIQISASGDSETGNQFLGIVWSDQDGQPRSARLEQPGVVPSSWTPRYTSLQYRSLVARAERGDDEQGFVARVLMAPELPISGRRELFSIQEESTEQIDESDPLIGDTTGNRVVDTNDLLAVLTHYNLGCDGMVPCEGDGNGDGVINVNDVLAVIRNFGVAQAATEMTHNRLLYWQPVGGSFHGEGDPNHIHPQIYNDEDGWQADIDHRIGPVVEYLGKGAFDMWFHNIGGYWYDHDQVWPTESNVQPMIFEQLEHAREQRPGLVDDLGTLTSFLQQNDIEYYAYIGLPRSWQSAQMGGFTPQDDHGKAELVHRFYGELLQHGFQGVGHDASVHNPATSKWLTELVPEVERRGMDVILESIPHRGMDYFLGHSVVAEHRVWEAFSEGNPEFFYTEDEITSAGGRAIHILTWPLGMSPNDPGWDPDFDFHTWRFETGKRLLEEGKTVAMGLNGLFIRGYAIEELVAAAQ
ncbi:MAG: hypothetical protein P8M32_09955 [Phycisphaerales bacterium]|jgi:hypothetical protein|nr:hypothetical protein [Phycisphaerales bacterium]